MYVLWVRRKVISYAELVCRTPVNPAPAQITLVPGAQVHSGDAFNSVQLRGGRGSS
jgi:hypothetical protein